MYRAIKSSNSDMYYYDEVSNTGMEYTKYSSFDELVYNQFTVLNNESKDRYIEGADTSLKKYGLDAYSYTALSFETSTESLDVVVGNGKAVIVDVDWYNVDSDEWFEHGTDKVTVKDARVYLKRLLTNDTSDKKFIQAMLSVLAQFA